MGLTASGFWYPDATTNASLQALFSAAATASENANKTGAVRNAIPKANSEAALTAVFTSVVDPVSGLALAPVVGSQGSINGIPVIYDGARWWGPAYTRMSIRRTAVFAATLNTWLPYANFGTTATSSSGSGLTLLANGIRVAAAGTYSVSGYLQFAANATGIRYMSLSTIAAWATTQWRVNNNTTGTDVDLSATCDIDANANDVIALYGYSSNVTVNITMACLWVRRVG